MEQQSLPFHVEHKTMPEHPIAVLSYDHGRNRVIATWPELSMFPASFTDWQNAIAAVVHPLNAHVRVRVHV